MLDENKIVDAEIIQDPSDLKPQMEVNDFSIEEVVPESVQSNILTSRKAENLVKKQLREFGDMIGEDLNITL